MTKTKTRIATVLQAPKGEVVVTPEKIRTSMSARDIGYVAIGFARRQEQRKLDEHGIAYVYVSMNESGSTKVEPHKDGIIATNSLAGCTGVAGFSRQKDGSILSFVSHYDAMSQNVLLTGKGSPANGDLWTFRHDSLTADPDGDTLFVVAYPESSASEPGYRARRGSHKEWHYLDQLEATAEYLGEGTRVILLPYNMASSGHTLASGRIDGHEGVFWDGVPLDFDKLIASSGDKHAV